MLSNDLGDRYPENNTVFRNDLDGGYSENNIPPPALALQAPARVLCAHCGE